MDLAELINIYRGPLRGLIASWGAPWGDATEISQDSFAEAYLNRDSCRGDWTDPDVFGRWLRGVAHNQYRNWSRGQRRRERLVKFESPAVEQAIAPSGAEPSEKIQSLREAIERLPDKLRQVVLMHYLEESSVKQIAILLSESDKTIEARLYQARKALRQILDKKPLAGKGLLCL